MSKRSRGGYVPGEDDFEDTTIHMPLDESYDPDAYGFDTYDGASYGGETYGDASYDDEDYDGETYGRSVYRRGPHDISGYHDGETYVNQEDESTYGQRNNVYGRRTYGQKPPMGENNGAYGNRAYEDDSYDGAYRDGSYRDGTYRDDSDRDGSYRDGSYGDDAYEDDSYVDSSYENGNDADDMQESSRQRKVEKKKPKRVKNKQIMGILYGFLILFFATIGYFVYFDVIRSEEALNNPNNIRIAKLADTITRGKILTSDGSVLAETLKDSESNEYRSYPYDEMFAHVVGMSKTNKSGIEASGEYYLLNSSMNPLQKAYNELKGEKNAGDNIRTTLDMQLQQTAYQALGSQKGVVIAMEPSTGRILAMVSKPDYNPNTLAQNYEAIIADENSKVLLNQATSGRFTPGSIFKMVTALEYIREYPNYSSYSYNCSGRITLPNGGGEATLTCYESHVHGTQGLGDSFANSCNASFAYIGTNLNIKKMNQLCDTMLFNQNLPTDIPHIQSTFSLSEDATDWQIGATAIGQGTTAMTPLHALILTSAVANGGVVMRPYLMDTIESSGGAQVKKFMPESYGSIMTTTEANLLKEMMQSVVSRGTAASLNDLGYNIAGKTGTAEVDNSGNNAWFVGFAPADSPKIAICVLVEDSSTSSSYTAVPIARQLFANYLAR